jgi:hypothetical protein
MVARKIRPSPMQNRQGVSFVFFGRRGEREEDSLSSRESECSELGILRRVPMEDAEDGRSDGQRPHDGVTVSVHTSTKQRDPSHPAEKKWTGHRL